MKSGYLLTLILTVTMTGFSFNWHGKCLNTSEHMSCNKTVHSVNVTVGENLILTCTCYNKTNGQWMGPKKEFEDSGDSIPYTQGLKLNKKLNKSKYSIFGGYKIKKCNLKISNFLSEDDGAYQCTYAESSTMYIDVYNVVATSAQYVTDVSLEHHVNKSMTTEICTLETNFSFSSKNIKYVALMSHRIEKGSEFTCMLNTNTLQTKFLLKQWILPVIVVLITLVVVTVILLWHKKDKVEHKSRQIHNIETYPRDDSIENQLYQTSQFLEINNFPGQNRVCQNKVLSSSQLHADQRYRARVTKKETGHCSRDIVSRGANVQIDAVNMNYAEVAFSVQPSAHRFIIHGNDDRTVYSEIDHAIKAEPLPSSSSESDDD